MVLPISPILPTLPIVLAHSLASSLASSPPLGGWPKAYCSLGCVRAFSPSVFPGPKPALELAEGSPPMAPIGFILVSFAFVTSKFTNVLDSFTSEFADILE